MRCFVHQDRDAIGSCKACSKGLCPDCAIDLGHGLACKGVHEETVETYNSLVTKNARVYSNGPVSWSLVPTFFTLFGIGFLVFGFFVPPGLRMFLLVFGGLFLCSGIAFGYYNRRIFRP